MLFVVLAFIIFIGLSNGTVWCYYSSSADTVRCVPPPITGKGAVTCATVNYDNPLPGGASYYLGPETTSHEQGWFNLYPIYGDTSWDYHTRVPDFDCRGGFGLHEGINSLGCITVSDHTCWNSLYSVITDTPMHRSTTTLLLDECSHCYWSTCLGGTYHDSVNRTVYDVRVYSYQ
eukprot:493568_1